MAKPHLDALIRLGSWAQADEDAKEQAVRDIMKDARSQAKAAVLAPPTDDGWGEFEAVR